MTPPSVIPKRSPLDLRIGRRIINLPTLLTLTGVAAAPSAQAGPETRYARQAFTATNDARADAGLKALRSTHCGLDTLAGSQYGHELAPGRKTAVMVGSIPHAAHSELLPRAVSGADGLYEIVSVSDGVHTGTPGTRRRAMRSRPARSASAWPPAVPAPPTW